ncbi:MAG: rhomboid family intramembrane serine protease [Chitinophagaceae bacterium]|jgi:membrane associated rhomboid family serine protease|nr:rhomboid family intramembrane serine protease [Chitinophagaceae bacterium]
MTQFRPTRFEVLPTIIKNLLIINGLVFLAQNTFAGPTSTFSFEDYFALHAWQSDLYKPWQLITHMFLHGDFSHILGNMFALWMFGSILENVWGPKRFLLFYMLCGVGAAVIHLAILSYQLVPLTNEYERLLLLSKTNASGFTEAVYNYAARHRIPLTQILADNKVSLSTPGLAPQLMDLMTTYYNKTVGTATLGASGAVFGILIAFVYLFPNTYIYIYFLFPVKAKWLGILYFGFELFKGIQNAAGDNVARWAHVGGALIGFVLVYIWKKKGTSN